MAIADDLEQIARQERELQFVRFDHEIAWRLGLTLRDLAVVRGHRVVIDVRRFGQQLFLSALEQTTPDNLEWVRRKTNTVARLLRSSYAVGLSLEQKQSTLSAKYALAAADYVSHGGSFPLAVVGAGVLGAVTVSGLDQRADHELVVEALCLCLGKSYEELKLASPDEQA
ncbi:MAG TPA: heme-degrading domain-containing protein [Acidobacteriaceae bacterium]